MKFRFQKMSLGLLLLGLLTQHASAYYLSANVMFDIKGFKTLNSVIDDYIKIKPALRITPLDKLTLKAKQANDLHMTLHALTIQVDQNLTQQQQTLLANIVEDLLKQAALKETKATAHMLKTNPKIKNREFSLTFSDFEVYDTFFVANFKLRKSFEQLIKNIDTTFDSLLQNSKDLHDKNKFSKDPIKSVAWSFPNLKQHVSLAKILDKPNLYAGTKVNIPVKVPSFTIIPKQISANVIVMP